MKKELKICFLYRFVTATVHFPYRHSFKIIAYVIFFLQLFSLNHFPLMLATCFFFFSVSLKIKNKRLGNYLEKAFTSQVPLMCIMAPSSVIIENSSTV